MSIDGLRRQEMERIIEHVFGPEGPRTYLEVGVNRGMTPKRLLKKYPLLSADLVDYWPDRDTEGRPRARSFRIAKKKLGPYVAEGRCSIWRMRSAEAAATIPKDKRWDVIFIDAEHTYEACLEDLNLWGQRARLLFVHDYGHPEEEKRGWGVTRAVDEWAKSHNITPRLAQYTLWWCLPGSGQVDPEPPSSPPVWTLT